MDFSGREFAVDCNQEIEVTDTPIGAIVTIGWEKKEKKKGNEELGPVLYKLRRDLSWENVLSDHYPYHLEVGKRNGTPR